MQRLQVELINRLGGDELHCRTPHSLSNRLGVPKIVLLAFSNTGERISPASSERHDQAPEAGD
jgi:hypothetical protein